MERDKVKWGEMIRDRQRQTEKQISWRKKENKSEERINKRIEE